jgi:hypothetical protein
MIKTPNEKPKGKPKKNLVTLQIHQSSGDKIEFSNLEANEFSDFILIRVDLKEIDQKTLEGLHSQFQKTMPDKALIIIDKGTNLTFYGLRELEESPKYEQLEFDI